MVHVRRRVHAKTRMPRRACRDAHGETAEMPRRACRRDVPRWACRAAHVTHACRYEHQPLNIWPPLNIGYLNIGYLMSGCCTRLISFGERGLLGELI